MFAIFQRYLYSSVAAYFEQTLNLYIMKRISLFLLPLLALTILFSACLRDECTTEQTYIRFDPIYLPFSEIRKPVTSEAGRPLKKPGKIFSLGNYMFINEFQEGIHVIDNSDPANPVQVNFWNIPGNVDLIIRGNYLYADQYTDLLTIDISDFQNPQIVCRAENVFPLFGFDLQRGLIIGYNETQVTEKINCGDNRWNSGWFTEGDVVFVQNDLAGGGIKNNSAGGDQTSLPAGVGIAGSFARFGIADEYLYTVDNFMLRSWSLSNPNCPARTDSTWLGWNAETIFPWKDKLFIGSQTGVFIFDNSNPSHPTLQAVFNHATGCDPVVCDDEHAYVTIHSGTTCNGTLNQMDVIDVKNLPVATLLKTFPMTSPKGLAITGEHLFLCDDGLKIFDRNDPVNLQQVSHLNSFASYDVIAFSDTHLLLIGDNGFYQFDVTDPSNPVQLSLIPVEN